VHADLSNDAYLKGAVCLQCTRKNIGAIADLLGFGFDLGSKLVADAWLVVECARYRADIDAESFCEFDEFGSFVTHCCFLQGTEGKNNAKICSVVCSGVIKSGVI